MRTSEHAIISVGYAGVVALMAGQGLTDFKIYIAALIGGEILDIIDHPLYHLVYNRNNPYVKEVRRLFLKKDFRSAIKYLYETEDSRKFKGLILHNVYSLISFTLLGIILSILLAAPTYLFTFFGALLLHMLTDVYGDFVTLGHINNWLWVLPESLLRQWGEIGVKVLSRLLCWASFIILGFLFVSFRWGWQLVSPSAYSGLYHEVRLIGYFWIKYIPLLGLILYFIWFAFITIASAHKYSIELGHNHKRSKLLFSLGSISLFWQFISGQIPRNKENFENVILRMQADQAVWIIMLASFISSTLMGLTWSGLNSELFLFVVPIFPALLFGTFIHTTIGQLGSVFGVLFAWWLNLILNRVGLQMLWPVRWVYLVFGAAIFAWILGLAGGIILKGYSQMSIVAFCIRIKRKTHKSREDARKFGGEDWQQSVLNLAKDSLLNGFKFTHQQLYAELPENHLLFSEPANLFITTYDDAPILGENYAHLQVEDSYSPIWREMAYVLCDNDIMSHSRINERHRFLPVMPRHRWLGEDKNSADMHWENSEYHWHSNRRQVKLSGTSSEKRGNSTKFHWLLSKTWSELVDHMDTRKSTIRTDIFIYPDHEEHETLVICGITRELTSTKEYATVEAEAYASAVSKEILLNISNRVNVEIAKNVFVRLFYPRVSIFDQMMVDSIRDIAIFPSSEGTISHQDFLFIKKSLDLVAPKKLLYSVTANLQKKLFVWLAQIAFTTAVAKLGYTPKQIFLAIINFLTR